MIEPTISFFKTLMLQTASGINEKVDETLLGIYTTPSGEVFEVTKNVKAIIKPKKKKLYDFVVEADQSEQLAKVFMSTMLVTVKEDISPVTFNKLIIPQDQTIGKNLYYATAEIKGDIIPPFNSKQLKEKYSETPFPPNLNYLPNCNLYFIPSPSDTYCPICKTLEHPKMT